MSLFLILLAAGDSKRLESTTPKPFHKINNKTLYLNNLRYFYECLLTIEGISLS